MAACHDGKSGLFSLSPTHRNVFSSETAQLSPSHSFPPLAKLPSAAVNASASSDYDDLE
jgi:hypothetical protein